MRVGSTAGDLDIVVEQGSTFSLPLTWRDSEGEPINLSGYKAILQVRDPAMLSRKFFEMSTENGMIQASEDKGIIYLMISREHTADLTFGEGVYNLELTQGMSTVRLLKGRFLVETGLIR